MPRQSIVLQDILDKTLKAKNKPKNFIVGQLKNGFQNVRL